MKATLEILALECKMKLAKMKPDEVLCIMCDAMSEIGIFIEKIEYATVKNVEIGGKANEGKNDCSVGISN